MKKLEEKNYLRCPKCGYLMPIKVFESARIDYLCQGRCGQRISSYQTIKSEKTKMQSLDIKNFYRVEDAPNYNNDKSFKAGKIDHVCVVGNGTAEGNPTVDFIFTDESGQKYIAMITGNLVVALAQAVKGMKLATSEKKTVN